MNMIGIISKKWLKFLNTGKRPKKRERKWDLFTEN